MSTRVPRGKAIDTEIDAAAEDKKDSPLAPDVTPTAQAEPQTPGGPTPDISKLEEALVRETPIGITILAVLAVLYTLYFARAFAIPITFAVLLSFLVTPIVRLLNRIHIPTPLGAAFVVLGLLVILGAAAYGISVPAQAWIAKAPQTLANASAKLQQLRGPIERVTKAAERVESATHVGGPGPSHEVVVRGPTLVSRVFGTTQALLTALFEIIILLYFFLAVGDLFLQKLVKVLPQLRDKKKAVQIARETEASISTYLFTVALINIGEGCVVALVMYLIGMPDAVLWGVLTVMLEFIPYVGAITMIAILLLAGLTSFNSVGHALLPPLCYLGVNILQSQIVSPLLLGHRLTLNPVAIVIGLSLWFFLWGISGMFLAVPLLAAFKILCDHIDALAPVGEFLGRRDEEKEEA